jgi:hypothetical protein
MGVGVWTSFDVSHVFWLFDVLECYWDRLVDQTLVDCFFVVHETHFTAHNRLLQFGVGKRAEFGAGLVHRDIVLFDFGCARGDHVRPAWDAASVVAHSVNTEFDKLEFIDFWTTAFYD